MGFREFTKKPFTDRLKDTAFLLKHTFTVVGKDEDIKTPTIRMGILTSIIITLVYSSFLLFFLGSIGYGVLVLLFTLFILIPFRFFFDTIQSASQSWIVYNTICGKDISFQDAHNHTKKQKGRLRLVALVDLLVAYANSQRGDKKGFVGVLVSIFLAALREVWDLLKHYLIPSIVIEQKPLKETIPKIKALRNNVPATLTGVFGIDFVGNVVSSLFGIVFIIMLALSVGLGYLIGLYTQATVVTLGTFSFSWAPILALLFITSLVGGVFKKIVQSIKVIYFTIFYTSIMQPKNITEDMRGELTRYLLMNEKPPKSKAK